MKNELFFKMPPILILAGGLGTRIHSITNGRPKYLMPINNEPFALYQLRLLKKMGFKEIVLCVGHGHDAIMQLLGDGQPLELNIRYSFDGDELLGTGGAIKKASVLTDSPFCVLYGDSYLDFDFTPVFQAFLNSKKSGMMTIFRNDNQWDKSNIEMESNQIVHYDKKNQTAKMHYVDFGFSLFLKDAFSCNIKTPFDLSVIFQELIKQKKLAAFEMFERFYEVGTPASRREFEEFKSRECNGLTKVKCINNLW